MSKQQLNDLDFQNVARILNLLDPTLAQHAATKNYVDTIRQKLLTTALLTNTSNVTLTNITELNYVLEANKTYAFEFYILFQSNAATTTGIALTLSAPAGTLAASVLIPVAADGTGGALQGWITASGDVVVGTGVQAINTTYLARIVGVIQTTAAGNFFPQFRSEVNGSQVSCRIGSVGFLEKLN